MNNEIKVNRETILSGTPISDGLIEGCARVFYIQPERTHHGPVIGHREIPEEISRVRQAFQLMMIIIEYSETFLEANIPSRHSGIFAMQKILLEEFTFRNRIATVIKENRIKAQSAIAKVVGEYIQRLSGSQSQPVRDRVSDLIDLKIGLIDALDRPNILMQNSEFSGRPKSPPCHIAITRELTPRFVIEQNIEGVKGIISEHGGRTSHAAILCRALGIPTVSEIDGIGEIIKDEDPLCVDGTSGRITLFPDKKGCHSIPATAKSANVECHPVKHVSKISGMNIMASINFSNTASEAITVDADGIGLYRTEFEFMIADRLLNEEEQFELYRYVVEVMRGKPVYIRLLDIQEDKSIASLNTTHVNNDDPTGIYGARFLLQNKEIFETQARALAKASMHGPINVIYPMILDLDQFEKLKAIFTNAILSTKAGSLKHGVMLEVPSACLRVDEILQVADFGCIGTNDLVSYLFGLDRNRDIGSAQLTYNHPLLRDIITNMVRAAKKACKPLLICGDLASRPENLGWLKECGIKIISAAPETIEKLREELYGL